MQERSKELAAAREKLSLLSQPVTTASLFCRAAFSFLVTEALPLATTKVAIYLVYPLVAGYTAVRFYQPELFAEPACGTANNGGILYMPQLLMYEAMWWLILGVLSSIGFGSGLHSGIMFLFPFVMRVVMAVEKEGSTRLWALYNHACALQSWGSSGDGTVSLFNQLVLVWPAVILWGAGTAFGELPPYFITRAARRTGKKDDAFEKEFEDAKEATDVISRVKVWTIDFTEKHGFVGIVLLASWPNAAFDMCGMACGWLDMPLSTFLGATLLGKSLIKTTLQAIFFINVFSKNFFDSIATAFDSLDFVLPTPLELGKLLGSQRQKLIYKFELQSRMTVTELLNGASSLDADAIRDEFCKVASSCGKRAGKKWSDAAAASKASEVAARIVREWDLPSGAGDLKLDLTELSHAMSRADKKLSLGSLDPGSGSLLSPGNLWNGFIMCMVVFFFVTIIDQVAKAKQAAIDEAEIEALEAGAVGGKAKAA